jgi:hypothetical protein
MLLEANSQDMMHMKQLLFRGQTWVKIFQQEVKH